MSITVFLADDYAVVGEGPKLLVKTRPDHQGGGRKHRWTARSGPSGKEAYPDSGGKYLNPKRSHK